MKISFDILKTATQFLKRHQSLPIQKAKQDLAKAVVKENPQFVEKINYLAVQESAVGANLDYYVDDFVDELSALAKKGDDSFHWDFIKALTKKAPSLINVSPKKIYETFSRKGNILDKAILEKSIPVLNNKNMTMDAKLALINEAKRDTVRVHMHPYNRERTYGDPIQEKTDWFGLSVPQTDTIIDYTREVYMNIPIDEAVLKKGLELSSKGYENPASILKMFRSRDDSLSQEAYNAFKEIAKEDFTAEDVRGIFRDAFYSGEIFYSGDFNRSRFDAAKNAVIENRRWLRYKNDDGRFDKSLYGPKLK